MSRRALAAALACAAMGALMGAPGLAHAATAADTIVLPARVPAQCVQTAAQRYDVPEMLIIAIVKQESDGHPVVSRNRNGSYDIGIAQINTNSWAPFLRRRYGISFDALVNDPCQALMAQAYILRRIANNQCDGAVLWCAVGYYHSPTPSLQRQYIRDVYRRYEAIIDRGHF